MYLNVIHWFTVRFIATAAFAVQDLVMSSQEVQPGQYRAAAKRRASLPGSCVHHCALCISLHFGAWDRLVRGMAWLCECEPSITTTYSTVTFNILMVPGWTWQTPPLQVYEVYASSRSLPHGSHMYPSLKRIWELNGLRTTCIARSGQCLLYSIHWRSTRRSVTFCDRYAPIWILQATLIALLCFAITWFVMHVAVLSSTASRYACNI